MPPKGLFFFLFSFSQARRNAPSVFICDGLDVLLPSGEGDGGGTPAREHN